MGQSDGHELGIHNLELALTVALVILGSEDWTRLVLVQVFNKFVLNVRSPLRNRPFAYAPRDSEAVIHYSAVEKFIRCPALT